MGGSPEDGDMLRPLIREFQDVPIGWAFAGFVFPALIGVGVYWALVSAGFPLLLVFFDGKLWGALILGGMVGAISLSRARGASVSRDHRRRIATLESELRQSKEASSLSGISESDARKVHEVLLGTDMERRKAARRRALMRLAEAIGYGVAASIIATVVWQVWLGALFKWPP
jgi:hypothetical protein